MTAAHGPLRDRPLHGVHRALVIGLGVSGRAAADVLREHEVSVTIVDANAEHPAADDARRVGHEVLTGVDPREQLGAVDLVVPSPGVPEHAPVLVAAEAAGIPVWSEPELAWRLFPRRLVGVTGTNGKTTTTELVAAMLRAGGHAAVACGNIGTPLTTVAATADVDALLVVELSSFQLRFVTTLRPHVGVLLNLAPDHLDWHPDLEAYGRAKARMWMAQGLDDWAVANADDPVTVALRDAHAPGRRAVFSANAAVETGVGRIGSNLVASGGLPHDGPIVAVDEIAGGGAASHLVANAAAAAVTALLLGTSVDAVREAATAYRPGRHRHEVVARRDDGVVFVDDSKATNVHAATAALDTAPSVVWIAGGRAKGVDLRPLASALGGVRAAVLIGEAADALAEVCAQERVPVHRADSIEEAVATAAALARPGDTVLLAPACASFDQFRDHVERGERFTTAARAAAGQVVVRGTVDRPRREEGVDRGIR